MSKNDFFGGVHFLVKKSKHSNVVKSRFSGFSRISPSIINIFTRATCLHPFPFFNHRLTWLKFMMNYIGQYFERSNRVQSCSACFLICFPSDCWLSAKGFEKSFCEISKPLGYIFRSLERKPLKCLKGAAKFYDL